LIVPGTGTNALGWLEQASPLARQVAALLITGVITFVAVRWMLAVHEPQPEPAADEPALQVSGVVR
ncbi:MAG TPA: hypothetical protein VFT99_24040, partial [Roseiflexaceae bacterium]|nr:hypothetical protein [Roseiflexaceae bacterium]